MLEVTDFYAALVESSDDAIIAKDIDGIIVAWNSAAERLFGWTAQDMIGQSIRRLLPEDLSHEEDDILVRIRQGERVGQFLTRRLHKSGELLEVSINVSPVRDGTGKVIGASKIARNAGPYLRQQAELLQSKARFETLANNIAPLCWMAEPDGQLAWYSQRWYDYTGTTLEEMEGWGWEKVQHPDHLERVKELWIASLASGEEWEDTFPLRRHDGEWRWFLSRAIPIRDEEGKVIRWLGTNCDITEQREQAEQIRLLLMEVNHRSKNMLATIQALLRRSVEGQDEFIRRFQERVRSMAVNQDILVRREWREVPLDELAELQLEFARGAPGSLVIEGPTIALNPRAAETIGMALHELATNSLKHGALSLAQGQVYIGWQAVDGELRMEWRESGGPPVTAPDRTGFGSTLISEIPRRVFGRSAEVEYACAGVIWRLVAPLELARAGVRG